MSFRFRQHLLMLGLLVLSLTLSFLVQQTQLQAWVQSPVSPLFSNVAPISDTPEREPPRFMTPMFWMSPLPWIPVGIVLFGALAALLVVGARYVHSRQK